MDLDDPDRAMVERRVATRQSELDGAVGTDGTSQDTCHLNRETVDARMLNVPTSIAQLLQLMSRNFSSLEAVIASMLLLKPPCEGEEYYHPS